MKWNLGKSFLSLPMIVEKVIINVMWCDKRCSQRFFLCLLASNWFILLTTTLFIQPLWWQKLFPEVCDRMRKTGNDNAVLLSALKGISFLSYCMSKHNRINWSEFCCSCKYPLFFIETLVVAAKELNPLEFLELLPDDGTAHFFLPHLLECSQWNLMTLEFILDNRWINTKPLDLQSSCCFECWLPKICYVSAQIFDCCEHDLIGTKCYNHS